MARNFKIALIQLALGGPPEVNHARCLARVREAAGQGGQVICLPELCRSVYFCQREDHRNFDLAQPFAEDAFSDFTGLARELGVAVIVPFFERRAAGLYHNSAAVIDTDGRRAGLYRKMHIPDDPAYYEKFYFTPGDLGFRAFPTAFGKIGTLICWDQWYPEAARIMALNGAPVLFYPTAIGWHPAEKAAEGARQLEAWMSVQRGHAVANGVYVAAVNRIGFEQPDPAQAGLEFWGSSFIAGPQGEIIARAASDREEILVAEVDLGRVEDVRRNWPFLRDRRIDAYGDILKRFVD
jgi:N-carbamoylputrescine amidase